MSDPRPSAGEPGAEEAADADSRTFDPERTIGGDADLLAEVRSAVEAARRGLAAPPPGTTDPANEAGPTAPVRTVDDVDAETGHRSATGTGPADGATTSDLGWAPTHPPVAADAASPPPDASRLRPPTPAGALAPPTAASEPTRAMPAADAAAGATDPTQLMPTTDGAVAATRVLPSQSAPATGPQRWVPPARLKPAATPAPAVFLDEPAPKRSRRWWIVGAAGLAVAIGVGVTIAVTQGDSTPSDDSTVTVPNSGASVPVTSPAPATSVTPTSARAASTTAAPTTTLAPTTTVAPSTAAPTTAAPPPETVAPDTVAPEIVPPETVPPPAGGG